MPSTARPLDHESIVLELGGRHLQMRAVLLEHLATKSRAQRLDEMARANEVRGGDTIYALDTRGEEVLLPYCQRWGNETPFLLICEGLVDGEQLFGCSRRE